MCTHSRAIRRTAVATGVVTALLALTAGSAWAALAQRDFEPQLWVGSTDLTHVAGQVESETQLGLNFGVELTGSGDLASTGDILLTVDLATVADVVVVTGLTADCDAAPTLITCQISPRETGREHQSMTLTAAANAEAGRTGTITVSASFVADKEATAIADVATIDVSVTPKRESTEPTESSQPTSAAAAATPPPPVVIAPLPTVPPSTSVPSTQTTGARNPTPKPTVTDVVIFTPSLDEVPEALATRQPGVVQTDADGQRYISYVGVAPASRSGSAALTIALGASSAGLVALIVFGIIITRRSNRPSAATRGALLEVSRRYRGDPDLPEPADPYLTESLPTDDFNSDGRWRP